MNYIEHSQWLMLILLGITVYIARVCGYWLVGYVKVNAKVEVWMNYLPGCILISLVSPLLLHPTWIKLMAAAICIILMYRTRSLLLSMVVSIGFVAIMRLFGFH